MRFSLLSIVARASSDEAPGWVQERWQAFQTWLRGWLVPPLQSIEAPIDRFFNGLPTWAGQACVTALFVAACLWALTRPRAFVYLGAPDQAKWRDLRIWAALLSTPYVLIYWFMG